MIRYIHLHVYTMLLSAYTCIHVLASSMMVGNNLPPNESTCTHVLLHVHLIMQALTELQKAQRMSKLETGWDRQIDKLQRVVYFTLDYCRSKTTKK